MPTLQVVNWTLKCIIIGVNIVLAQPLCASELKKVRIEKMYKVVYQISSGAVRFKSFNTFRESTEFCLTLPNESVLEVKYCPEVGLIKNNND